MEEKSKLKIPRIFWSVICKIMCCKISVQVKENGV